MRRKTELGLLIIISGCTWPDFASAQIPRQINHQGVVTADGQRFNGTGIFRFALVDANGTYIWANDDHQPPISAPTIDVMIPNIVDGIYSVSLGAPPMNQLPPSAFTSSDFKVRVWFNDGTHNLQQLSPDQAIGSVPFASNGVPPGTIVAFAGAIVPNGWLPCDGQQVSRTSYPALYAAIGSAWGWGDQATTFNIPNLRGLFLRGVLGAGQPGWDPDSNARGPIDNGGNIGNSVGSWQDSAFQGHFMDRTPPGANEHVVSSSWPGIGITPAFAGGSLITSTAISGNLTTGAAVSDGTNGVPRVSKETRPANAYVNYIIKY